jgi:hypothetical protein
MPPTQAALPVQIGRGSGLEIRAKRRTEARRVLPAKPLKKMKFLEEWSPRSDHFAVSRPQIPQRIRACAALVRRRSETGRLDLRSNG